VSPRDVDVAPLAAVHEPLRPELACRRPHGLVAAHLRDQKVHLGALRHGVAADLRVGPHAVRQHEVARRVQPQALQHDGLEVRHRLELEVAV